MGHKKRKSGEGAGMNRERLIRGLETLAAYRRAKAPLEAGILENEEWWRLGAGRAADDKGRTKNGAWLFNSVAAKHADAMDNIPTPSVLPREPSDSKAARELSGVLPAILAMNYFEGVWSDCWYDKLKSGCGIYGVFWDSEKLGSLGDISIKRVDPLSLFWDPDVTDIQDSENIFHISFMPDSLLNERWQFLKESLSCREFPYAGYIYSGNSSSKGKSAVIDWYYKKRVKGRNTVQFCKSVNGTLIYASENDPLYRETGYYNHGLYPFVFDSLYSRRSSPCGFGCIDIMKGCQEKIDLLENAVMLNSRMAAHRRYFAREASGINEEEFADWTTPIVHYSGSGNPTESVMPIEAPPLAPVYLDMLEYKVKELKETSGNRDFTLGGTISGVTAASAIEALQEAGGKLSRDMLKGSYRAYEKVLLLVIELIRQFYSLPRCFRINGGADGGDFREFDNSSIVAQKQGVFESRLPMFDIVIKAEKQSPYGKAAVNELARTFFEKGFFSREKATEALICLDMMDFEGKEKIRGLILAAYPEAGNDTDRAV